MAPLILLYLCLCSMGTAQDIPQDIAESLLNLMTEERQLRGQLEKEVDMLETELAQLKRERQNVTCSCPASSGSVAFSAVLTTTLSPFGKLQPIVFNKVNINVGNAYDARHGTFVAPFEGTYEFTFAGLTPGGYNLAIELVLEGKPMAKARMYDSNYYTMGTNVVALNMHKGEEVWVRHMSGSDSNYLRGDSYTSFSGYLIEG